ncbi:MAG TPA: hypothetical protein VEX57_16735 [Microlunatus sp.]|nr:hypothetical protein [Microlunatus sp.]
MGDNFRWLVALAAASVTIVVVVSAYRRPSTRTRGRCVLGIGSLLLAWAASELPPFVAWTSGAWTDLALFIDSAASPQVLVACAAYFGIAMASSRGLIGMPIYRQLQARAGELRGIIDTGCFEISGGQRLETKIDQAERSGARCIGRFVVLVPLADVLAANRTLNGLEKQMLSTLSGAPLRLAASQIAALLPPGAESVAAASRIAATISTQPAADGLVTDPDGPIRNAAGSALILLQRQRDAPQEREVNHIRVAVWLTLVGLAATYALSVTFPGREPIFVAGALGGLLGSLSALFMNRTLSLGMVVLSPVAGALNAIGGIMIVGFLAQDQIALLGDAFAGVWSDGSASLTALAVAVLLGFSGGLFSRIAVAGTAPLLGAAKEDDRARPDVTLVSPQGDPTTQESPVTPAGGVTSPATAALPTRNGHSERSSARRMATVLVERRSRER